jgi:hypothetical protein
MRAGVVGAGSINRRNCNINSHALLDNGGMIVSDEVIITINTGCLKTKATTP